VNIVNPAKLDFVRANDTCIQCHCQGKPLTNPIEGRYFGPGHTGGDAVFHFQRANVMHMGDLLFNRAHPNIDRPAGANIASWIRALEQATDAASSALCGEGRAELAHVRVRPLAARRATRARNEAKEPRPRVHVEELSSRRRAHRLDRAELTDGSTASPALSVIS